MLKENYARRWQVTVSDDRVRNVLIHCDFEAVNVTNELVIGVDGGGTKTAAWLARLDGNRSDPPLGSGLSGPGNPRSAGFDTAFANIEEAIDSAFADAGIRRGKVHGMCLALAGADRASERARLNEWCSSRDFADHVQLTNDADPLLAAASDDGYGIALIAGTGSIAFGRDGTGKAARCGGWGYLIGDEGSAYWMAVEALRAAVRSADSRATPTLLLEMLQQRLNVSTPQDFVTHLYRPEMSRQEIADLAEVVFAAADQQDSVAVELVHRCANELAALVATLSARLGFQSGRFPLALAGGLLLHQKGLQQQLYEVLRTRSAEPAVVTEVPEPVRGAVAIARRYGRERIPLASPIKD